MSVAGKKRTKAVKAKRISKVKISLTRMISLKNLMASNIQE